VSNIFYLLEFFTDLENEWEKWFWIQCHRKSGLYCAVLYIQSLVEVSIWVISLWLPTSLMIINVIHFCSDLHSSLWMLTHTINSEACYCTECSVQFSHCMSLWPARVPEWGRERERERERERALRNDILQLMWFFTFTFRVALHTWGWNWALLYFPLPMNSSRHTALKELQNVNLNSAALLGILIKS